MLAIDSLVKIVALKIGKKNYTQTVSPLKECASGFF